MWHGPVVVGGMGGSGSRPIVRVLVALGFEMGRRNDPQEDALDVVEFDYRWAPPFLNGCADLAAMRREFDDEVLPKLRADRPWGWKHNPSAHVLPFYAQRFPDLRFIHVIRDGRDVAAGASGGRTHTLRLGRALLDGDPAPILPGGPAWNGREPTAAGGPEATPERMAAFWARANRDIAQVARRVLGERYLRVRLEDMVADQRDAILRIARFVGVSEPPAEAADLIERPPTIGRWTGRELGAAVEAMRDELELFGYLEPRPPSGAPAGDDLVLPFGSLDLRRPAASLDEDGRPVALPERLPERAGHRLRVATLAGGAVAVARDAHRAYLLDADGCPVPVAGEGTPAVRRRAERDLGALGTAERRGRPDAVALISGARSMYWHWWIDVISRIWLLHETGGAAASLGLAFAPLRPGFQAETVRVLGLDRRIVVLEPGRTRLRSVTWATGVAPGASRFPSPRLAAYVRWLHGRLGDVGALEPRRRLFVTRVDAASRRVVNEDEVVALLGSHGFEVIECARLPLAEQIRAFAGAELVVGPHGAGLTNLLFARPGTRVLELFAAPAALGISNYRVLASHLGQPYARLLASPAGESGRPHDFDMRVDLRALERSLRALGV